MELIPRWLRIVTLVFLILIQMVKITTTPETSMTKMVSLLKTDNLKSVLVVSENQLLITTTDDYEYRVFGTVDDQLRRKLREQGEVQEGFSLLYAPPVSLVSELLKSLMVLTLIYFLLKESEKALKEYANKKEKQNSQGERTQTTFIDVAGAAEAKRELQEIIDFLRDPGPFIKAGANVPKGVLLTGPPGTGKTLLARAVAGEANVPFLSVSGSQFVDRYVGSGSSSVRKLFENAQQLAPCIVFIDEIDAVGHLRSDEVFDGGTDERNITLNQLLTAIDGFEASDGVIVLGATNRPNILDPALLRSGRFDRHIEVGLPEKNERVELLRVHTRKIPHLDRDVNFGELAKLTPGCSGADIANLVNEAVLLSLREKASTVTMTHFERAAEKILLGGENHSLVQSATQLRSTAYHEVGHALVALLTKEADPPHKVTIVSRGQSLGSTLMIPEEDEHSKSRLQLLARLTVSFGGRAAEELVFGAAGINTGAQNDLQEATKLAYVMVREVGMGSRLASGVSNPSPETRRNQDVEVEELLQSAYKTARDLLEKNRQSLDRIAQTLLEKETLSKEEISALINQVSLLVSQ